MADNIPALDDFNGWADFWRYQIGVNVIPAVYRLKVPKVKWEEWQTNPISKELHDQWKSDNMFKDGMGIVTGNVWHNDKVGEYLACMDTDNGLATERISISAKITLVQQRKNALDRAHSYFYSPRPVKRKPGSSSQGLNEKFDRNEAPKFEIRCIGDLVYTGKHSSGYYYENVGQPERIDKGLELDTTRE